MERGMECGMEHGMERGIEWHVICTYMEKLQRRAARWICCRWIVVVFNWPVANWKKETERKLLWVKLQSHAA